MSIVSFAALGGSCWLGRLRPLGPCCSPVRRPRRAAVTRGARARRARGGSRATVSLAALPLAARSRRLCPGWSAWRRARPAEGTWIEVSPSTVQAGEQVAIKASCKDRVDEAKARSKVFGEVVLVPQWGFLVGDATVPADTRAGDYEVKLTCVKSGNAETKLKVIAKSRPSHGPHTGGGGLAGYGQRRDRGAGRRAGDAGRGRGPGGVLRRRRRLV